MADRTYRGPRERNDRDRYSRQAEQFDAADYGWRDDERSFSQMEGWREEDYGQFDTAGQSYSRDRDAARDWGRDPGYRRQSESRSGQTGYAPARPDYSRYAPEPRGYASFTGNDYGGRDFNAPRYTASRAYRPSLGYGAGSRLAANHGEWRDTWDEFGPNYAGRYGRDRDERGWFDRASDTVASWFGDEDAERRRRMDYRGHGPSGYTRSDERIREDANDALTNDWGVDARQISVTVDDGEVTLDGTVPSRDQKRRAEDLIDDLSGVRNVQNNLRVQQPAAWDRNNSGEISRTEPSG